METGATFRDAWEAARRAIVFTTHTPIPAGNEVHALADLRRLGACLELVDGEMRAIGGDPFNMTVAGLRLARRANAVSKLHAEVSREMWKGVDGAAEIIAITNGAHVPTWQDPRVAAAGSPESLWAAHLAAKDELCAMVRARTGASLDRDALLVGFARRAATYKRSDLIFRDLARFERLMRGHRLQLVFSGKNHPDDPEGRRVVANLLSAARRFPDSVVFVPDYDMGVARLLTRGTDVWLNNPVRPLEACGTSGMKAAMNGSLNLSIPDGWWPEACRHGVNGWSIGDGTAVPNQDDHDFDALHAALEGEVLPAWADRARWIGMMQASIATVAAGFSASRMVRDYFARLYPAG
jgi:starch phosphorylase